MLVEAVRVSIENVRVSIEALRCIRGRESVAEVKKVPIEVIEEPVGQIFLKQFWNTSTCFGFVSNY